MSQIGADRPASGSRIGQLPALFAADPDLLRPAWRRPDSFDRYFQQAKPPDASAPPAPPAVTPPRAADPETPSPPDRRDAMDQAPGTSTDAPPPSGADDDRADDRPDGEGTGTAAAGDSEPASGSGASDESRETGEDNEGNGAQSNATTQQRAATVALVPLENAGAKDQGEAGKTPTDGEKTSGAAEAENAKPGAEPAKHDAAASKSTARTNTAGGIDPVTDAPTEPAEEERQPDGGPESENSEGQKKGKPSQEPVSPRDDAPRLADAAPKPAANPQVRKAAAPGREVAPPGESSSDPEGPPGRPERAAGGEEPAPRRVRPADRQSPAHGSAATPSHRPDAAPAGVESVRGQSPASDGSSSADEPQAPGVKPLRGADAELKGDVPLRVTAEARAGARASRPDGAGPETGQIDRARFVQRVARAFEAMGGRQGVVRLRLHPPELGSLRLEIHVRGGVLNARVEAENASVRNLLLDQLPQLRERLAQQDIKVQHFDVDLSDRSAGDTSQQTAYQAPGDGERSGRGTPPSKPDGRPAVDDVPPAGATQAWHVDAGRLDVLI